MPSFKSPEDVGVLNIDCLITGRRRGSDGFKPHRASDLTHPSYSSSTEASVLPQNTFVMAETNEICRFCFNRGEEAQLATEMKRYRLPVCQEVGAIDRRWGKR